MNTTFRLVVACEEAQIRAAEQTLRECHALIHQIETEISEFIETSPVFKLNHAERDKWIPFSGFSAELLDSAIYLAQISAQAFSPFAKSYDLNASVKIKKFESEIYVSKNTQETRVGFGAIGKGFALDKVREKLEAEGLKNYLLEAGGSSTIFSGFATKDQPWGWAWMGIHFYHVTGKSIALGISGTEEQGCHIVDPRNGIAPAEKISSLVGHVSATYADALSTALFVAGWEETLKSCEALIDKPGLGYLDAHRVPRWNGTFQNYWGPIEC